MLPKGSALHEHLRVVTCVLEVDRNTTKIVDVSFSTVIPLTNDFLRRLLVGHHLNDGLKPIQEIWHRHCYLLSERAFFKAFAQACNRYAEYQAERMDPVPITKAVPLRTGRTDLSGQQ